METFGIANLMRILEMPISGALSSSRVTIGVFLLLSTLTVVFRSEQIAPLWVPYMVYAGLLLASFALAQGALATVVSRCFGPIQIGLCSFVMAWCYWPFLIAGMQWEPEHLLGHGELKAGAFAPLSAIFAQWWVISCIMLLSMCILALVTLVWEAFRLMRYRSMPFSRADVCLLLSFAFVAFSWTWMGQVAGWGGGD